MSSPPWTLLLITVLQPKLLWPYLHRFASKFTMFLRTLQHLIDSPDFTHQAQASNHKTQCSTGTGSQGRSSLTCKDYIHFFPVLLWLNIIINSTTTDVTSEYIFLFIRMNKYIYISVCSPTGSDLLLAELLHWHHPSLVNHTWYPAHTRTVAALKRHTVDKNEYSNATATDVTYH